MTKVGFFLRQGTGEVTVRFISRDRLVEEKNYDKKGKVVRI
jgi:hypothetical protein